MPATPNRRGPNQPVYSTDGRTVVDRRRAAANAWIPRASGGGVHPSPQPAPRSSLPRDGVVRVARDRKGRGGKTVTVVSGLPGSTEALAEAAARLKKLCSSGGTVKDGVIEIQGDHREQVAGALRALGHTVKLVGG